MPLSNKQIKEVIRRGETVVLNGVSYGQDNLNDVPSDAELAKGDAKKEAAAIADIKAQQAALQAQLEQLESSKAEAEKAARAEAKSESGDEAKKEAPKAEAPKAEAKSDKK